MADEVWFAIIDGSGGLVSVGTVVADDATLAAQGYSSLQLASDPHGQIWNPTTRTFGPAPKPQVMISTWRFIQRFTAAEYAGVEASTDPQVRQFLTMIMTAQTIFPGDAVVQQGLAYLVGLNLLTSDRAAAIGAF